MYIVSYTFRQKLNTYIYIYVHTHTLMHVRQRRCAYIQSFVHTSIHTSKTLFCVRIYGRHFLFYFVAFSMFTCA